MLVNSFIVVNRNKNYCNLKAIDIDLAKRKVHNFDRGRGFANINFHGKEGKFGLNLYDSLNIF